MHKCLSNASCPPGDFHNNWCTSVQPCTVFFCTSTLKSLFVIFLGLKTKMWNVMDTWIILENHNFLLLLPQQSAPFSLFTEKPL